MKSNKIPLMIGMFAAITSSKVLNIGKGEVTQMLTGLDTPVVYTSMGAGESATAAAEGQSGLQGTKTNFKSGNVSYFVNTNSSYIAQWNSSWVYDEVTDNIINEVIVNQSSIANATNVGLLRAVFDTVTLGSGDSLAITAQVAVSEG